MLMQACKCGEGHGCPHTHETTAEVRRLADNVVVRISHDFIPQPGYELISETKSIRYWGETITVPTADLALVALTLAMLRDVAGVKLQPSQSEPLDRLLAAVEERRRSMPVPDPERLAK